tara:strand:+ start:2693 stop:4546 length:1854 start_codon:yes stop_codon:yes gene_type:complete
MADASFREVVEELKKNKDSQDAGFDKLENAITGGSKENKGALEEQKKKEVAARKREETLFGEIAFGIKEMNKSLKEGLAKLQDKGLGGLGMIAGLIAGPFIAIRAFFTQIGKELKFLQTLVKGNRIQKAFAPIKNFFAAVARLTKTTFSNAQLKTLTKINMKPFVMVADLFKAIGRDLKPLGTNIVKQVKTGVDVLNKGVAAVLRFLTPVTNFFKGIISAAKSSASFMGGLSKVLPFFKTIGTTLGKFFLPVTVIMSVFDAVTGFMDGYDQGGVIGGIQGAITKVFNGLVAMPLNLLKDLLAFVLGIFGFDNAKAALNEFDFAKLFTNIFDGIFNGVRGAVDFIKELFTFPEDGGALAAIGKLIDILLLPLNTAINFVKGMFGFTDEDGGRLPPFSIGKFITEMIEKVINYVKDIFPSFEDLKNLLPSAGDLISGFKNLFSFGGDDKEEETPEGKEETSKFGKRKEIQKELTEARKAARIAERELEKAMLMSTSQQEKFAALSKRDDAIIKVTELEDELRKARKRQFGGPVLSSVPYIVGERGPELFIPKTDGMIKNEQQTNQMMQSAVGKGGGGGATVVNAPTFAPMSSSSSSTTSTSAPIVQLDPILNRASQYAI